MRKKLPCMNCAQRHEACHGSCEEYREWKADRDAERRYTREQNDAARIGKRDFDAEFWM